MEDMETNKRESAGAGFYIKNIIWISILWLICSIPVITAGASCSAAYRTVHRVLYRKDQETWKVFKTSFKENFAKATKCWIVLLIVGAVFFGIGWYLFQMDVVSGSTSSLGMYAGMFFIMFIYVCLWAMYTFAYNVRFDDPAGVILKNCLYLVLRHLPSTIIMGVIMGVMAVLIIYLIFPVIFAPALGCFLIFRFMEKVFSHYMTKEEYFMILGKNPEKTDV